ncbi:MAG: orotate phosphoribosyltransferase [Candidatus Pacebacteria bacterium]|nr:orotate phosphoribosyltransferase [Candidatus Paceibacterota bacterium]
MDEKQVLKKLRDTNALLSGHFLLRSGLHSDKYFQAALVLQHTRIAEELCSALAATFKGTPIDTVISPAVGGIVVGQEVGRACGVRAVFAEKDGDGGLVLRRGFRLEPGENVLVAEDVVTRGGRVQQTIDLVRAAGANVAGVAVLVDRSGGQAEFGVPLHSLVKLQLTTYRPEECPLCKAGKPLEKPGS